ncbi:MAG: ABC transporter ATP-binding protein [Gammaproteobacteria bacterium]|nr:MAG: ABC transporter ATP-binding protein [Gammaproteobacteria bacterium]
MNEPLLEVQDLQVRIGRGPRAVRAVDGVSFVLHRGETFALLGESGCGKSMTALSIMRLLPRPAGRIVGGSVRLDGQDLLDLPERDMRQVRGGRIAMIFQEPMTSLNPVLTVGQQIAEVLALHKGLRGRAAESRVRELLDAVGIPDSARRMKEYPHQLSGGMKQRVMIAMALAGEPELLIADEPTTALDVTIQAQVLELLQSLQARYHMALLLITHDLGVVAGMADRLAVMYAGQLVEQATRADFFREPLHPYGRKLFEALPEMDKRGRPLTVIPGTVPPLDRPFTGCPFAPRCDYRMARCEAEPPPLHRIDGREVRCHLYGGEVHVPPAPERTAPDRPRARRRSDARSPETPLLEVRGLKVHFPIRRGLLRRTVGHVHAVDGVDLRIGQGQTLALVGESGCGKTTAGKAILQLLRPTAGSVRFDGTELTRLRGEALRRRRREFQIIFQDPYSSMNPRMMIRDIVEEGMRAQGIGRTARERHARARDLLLRVGLREEHLDRYPHEFSGGQRQRICIARALAVEPRLIVCDEPTSALDVSVQAQILNLLSELQRDFGLAYLFITHNLSVVGYLADRVAVMYLGRLVEEGPVAGVLEAPLHPYTEALISAVPRIDPEQRREIIRLEGDLPSPTRPPSGCHFHPRCPKAQPICARSYPEQRELRPGHWVKCHVAG